MTKLSYSGRKFTGTKIGTIVQKDIIRRIPKDTKSSTIVKDSGLELVLAGKGLGDDGFKLVCDALVMAITCNALHLEELNLSANEITAQGLSSLATVIRISPDIKELDLSKNKIAVTTADDVGVWQKFLQSLAECKCLRRLDLASNPLGDWAIEILHAVYVEEEPLHLPRTKQKDDFEDDSFENYESSDEIDSTFDQVLNISRRRNGSGTYEKDSVRKASTSTLESEINTDTSKVHSTDLYDTSNSSFSDNENNIHGLRSVPYIVLSETNLTDASALWLSHILPLHARPWELLPLFPPIKDYVKELLLEKYHLDRSCKGIIWNENTGFGSYGLKALNYAEGLRGWNEIDERCLELSKSYRISDRRKVTEGIEHVFWPWSMYGTPSSSVNVACDPEAPPLAVDLSLLTTETMRNDLDRTRLKIQGIVLREKGVQASLLWKTTLRLLATSRTILFGYNDPINFEGLTTIVETITLPATSPKVAKSITVDASHAESVNTGSSSIPEVKTEIENPGDVSKLPQLASPVTITPLPKKKLVLAQSRHSDIPSPKSSPLFPWSAGVDVPHISKPSTLEMMMPSFSTKPDKDNIPMKPVEREPTRRKLPVPEKTYAGLPVTAWLKIISYAEDPMNIVSSSQKLNIFDFARSKETLHKEMEYLGKLESFQIRRVLEKLDCLVYKQRK